MKKLFVFFLILLFITMGFVSASDNIGAVQTLNQNENITISEKVYEIDDGNYDEYFDSNGQINKNSNITDGDTIKLGNITDKKLCIDKSLTITQITSNDILINTMINLVSGSVDSNITNIKLANNKNTKFSYGMLLENTDNVTIDKCYFAAVNPIKNNIMINSSNQITITNSTFVNKAVNYTGQCEDIIFERNNITNILDFNSIIANNLSKIEKNSSKFEAQFLEFIASPLENKEIIFKINGVEYKRTTDNKGIARIAINLGFGEYLIQSINPVTREIKNNTITVLPRIVKNKDLEKFYRNASQYLIKVLDDTGNPAKANETVTFNINGVFYNRTTNASGYVKLNINLQQGDYIITAEYKGCKVSNKIKVKSILSADDLTKKYGTPDQFKAKLVDGEGNPLANTNVTFNINGVFYNRTTDSDGIAKLNIRLMPGEYIITSSYNECYISNKITVTA